MLAKKFLLQVCQVGLLGNIQVTRHSIHPVRFNSVSMLLRQWRLYLEIESSNIKWCYLLYCL